MSDQDGFLPAPPPIGARWPLTRLLRVALSTDFEHLDQAPPEERLRLGVVGACAGTVLVIIGLIIARWLSDATGLPMNKLFGIVAGYGAIVLGVGIYRIGGTFFPSLEGTSRAASLARMSFVLVVFSALGAIALYVLLGE